MFPKIKWVLLAALSLSLSPALWAGSEAYTTYLHGLLAERKGDLATALSDYQKAAELDPQALEVFRDLAQLNLRTGHTDAALQAAKRVRDLAPTESSSFIFLGHVYIARGDLALAAQEYEKALQLDPKNLKALENLANYYSSINPRKALDYYKRYLDIDPQEAEIYFQIGFLQQRNNDTKASIEAFKKSIELDPHQVASHLALAELYEMQKSTASAIEQYQACVKLDPRNPAFYAHLGHLYFQNKQWEEAASQFQSARALEPKDATHSYYLARIAEERGQWLEAGTFAEAAYNLSHDAQFLPLLAYYLTMQHRTQDAVTWLEKARKADPKSANVALFLGMDYLELNKNLKAKEILEAAGKDHPRDPQLQFQLGIAYDRLGRFEDAVKQFEHVLQLDAKNAAAMNYLAYSYAERAIHLDLAEPLAQKAVKLDDTNGAYWDTLGWVHFKQGKFSKAVEELEKASFISSEDLIYEHLGEACFADQKVDRALAAWAKALSLNPKNKALEKKIDEVSRGVAGGPNQRKFLKVIEGNFRQISDLNGLVRVEGRWKKQRVKTQGGVYYLRPDRILLAIGGPAVPVARVSVKGQQIDVQPQDMSDQWNGIDLKGLTWLPLFFSGKLLASLYDSSVITQDNTLLHYKSPNEEAWVDASRSVLTRYIRDNPQGGRDILTIKTYDLIEGLWLPRDLSIENESQSWRAEMHFSNWQINEPQTAHVFDTPQP